MATGKDKQELHVIMQAGASTLDELFNGKAKGKKKKIGFILIAFPFEGKDENKRCSITFNRADIKPQLEAIFEHLTEVVNKPGVKITVAKYDS